MTALTCRFCSAPLSETFVDLGASPLANAYRTAEECRAAEPFFPLHTYRCRRCSLVQLPAIDHHAVSPEGIFSEYAYFSSFSDSWLAHAEAYAEAMVARLELDADSLVVEVASNDGYLLRFFRERSIPVLGIEPAANIAAVAEAAGIPTRTAFFGTELARGLVAEGRRADLLVANNVLAHTPHLNDFVAGLATVLAPNGTLTLEFPHLVELIEHNQFDTIYHEHFSYFSFTTVTAILAHHGLAVFDVEQLATHGGSLRVFARPADVSGAVEPAVAALLDLESSRGYRGDAPYADFAERVKTTKRRLLRFLVDAKDAGKRIAAYGAPAKGNTLLNYCGVRSDFVDFTVDRSPHKQGKFLPGTHIPIRAPDDLRADPPDYLLILPWNLRDEIAEQMADLRADGCQFVVAIPEVEVLP